MLDTIVKQEILKGGEFIVKNISPEDIFIPEELDEEQEMVRGMVKDFVNENQSRGGKLDQQVALLQQAGELGLLGSHIPEEYGGMRMGTNTNTVIGEELGYLGGGFTTTWAAHIGIGTLPILYFGTEEQKQKYLPKLATGELKAAYCLTEPSSGSDALAAKTRADLSKDGQHYVLNGQKMWITNAGFADVFIVFAKIDGQDFTGFILERGMEGLSFGAEEEKLGIKGSSTRQVFFENVKVPVNHLLGEKGKGHLIAFNILNVGRFKLGLLAMGGTKHASTTSIKYANERKQFKKAISSFGAIQYKLAEQAIRAFALESSVYRVSNLLQKKREILLSEGKSYKDALLESAEQYAIECALIKVTGSEITTYAVDEMVQVHGGYGFSEEYPAAQAYRDARITRIYEGTNEINRMLMVSRLLKNAMKGEIDIVAPAWAVQKELATPINKERPTGKYGEEIKAVQDFKKIILMVTGAAAKMQMEGKLNLKEEQELLTNIADLMIDTYNAESALLRVQKLAGMEKSIDQAVYDNVLKVFVADATARIQKNATDALCSFVEEEGLLNIFIKGLRRFTAYPPVNVKAARRVVAAALIEANEYCL